MSSSINYEQVAESVPLYEIKVAGSVGWSGYILPQSADLPTEISLTDSLNDYNGSYVFAVSRPTVVDSNPSGFASDLNNYVNQNVGKNSQGLFWLQSVEPVSFGPFANYGFRFNFFNGAYTLQSNLNISLGTGANFFLLQSLNFTINDDKQAISIYTQLGPSALIGFQKGPSDMGVNVGNTGYNNAYIPVSGTNAGCLVFAAQLSPAKTFSPPTGLAAGFNYVVNTTGADTPIYYAGLDLTDLPASVSAIGAVDPSDPFNARLKQPELLQGCLRTGFALIGQPSLTSGFRTAGGQPVSLLPLGATAGEWMPPLQAGALALASSSPTGTLPAQSNSYFTFSGNFGIGANAYAPGSQQQLVCGLSGSERLSFINYNAEKEQNDMLFFLLSQPGYAPVFPFETVDLNQPASGNVQPRLTSKYLTQWATILQSASDEIKYSAEPDGSPLYGFDDTAPGAGETGDVQVLFSAPPSMPLTQGVNHTFPLVPYGLISSPGIDNNTLTQFESQIISPTRKSTISKAGETTWLARENVLANLEPVETDLRTTPQGFVATVETSTGAYLNVAMAQSLDRTDKLLPFAFDKPTRQLQDALQTNQLFLVAVNNQYLADPTKGAEFANTVYISDWKMTATVGNGVSPTDYRNVMIFKFCDGSLQERVTNPNRWTNPENFSLVEGSGGEGISALAYTGLSQWLQDYIAEGIARADGPSASFYKNFKDIVTNPDWRGVIVLEADLSAEDMPPEIQGLAAGIDFTNFTAHHFGFTVSRVVPDKITKKITMDGVSSLFGLVDYMNPAYAQNLASGVDADTPIPIDTANDFDFTVLQLQSLFENARLKEFQSHVQLTVDSLFASPTIQTFRQGVGMPVNGVVLNGSYVDQNGVASYVFQQTQTNVFTLDSNALQAVAFSRVQFNTLGPRDGGNTIASRFLIWGAFDFVELKDNQGELLDVLSFGSPDNTTPPNLGEGLAFSNLLIDMAFPATTPNAKTFLLDTDNMAYDQNASQAREQSLFQGFGLELKTFINASGGKTPSNYGYLPVTSGLNLTQLEGAWFGVVYQVTLGGPGALASAVGFNSNLLMAWSPATKPEDTQRAVFVGLSLPGASPGASLFSIEGVFKVAVGSIAILRQLVPKTEGSSANAADNFFYCLRLDDIGIKILGIVKLPPDANIQFFLFGDPSNTGALGWYAAYVAKDNPGCKQQELGFAPLASDNQLISDTYPNVETVK